LSDPDHYPDPPRLTARRYDYAGPDELFHPPRRRRHSLFGRIVRSFALMAVGAFAVVVLMLALTGDLRDPLALFRKNTQPLAAVPAAASPVSATVPAETPIALQAQQWGIATCLGPIADIEKYLSTNADMSWRLIRGMANPDQELFAGSLLLSDRASGLRGIATMFTAPVVGGRCDGGYDVVIFVPETCEQARARKPPGFDTRLDLGPIAEVYAATSGSGSVTLMPAGATGCIMVRNEFFY
jgi:hypothetical protein